MDLTSCPDDRCGLPAEIRDRFTLPSTDGPVEHVQVLCVGRHHHVLPTSWLPTAIELRDAA
jgi:hypothetical protein